MRRKQYEHGTHCTELTLPTRGTAKHLMSRDCKEAREGAWTIPSRRRLASNGFTLWQHRKGGLTRVNAKRFFQV
jgi:hypothetical protein